MHTTHEIVILYFYLFVLVTKEQVKLVCESGYNVLKYILCIVS